MNSKVQLVYGYKIVCYLLPISEKSALLFIRNVHIFTICQKIVMNNVLFIKVLLTTKASNQKNVYTIVFYY